MLTDDALASMNYQLVSTIAYFSVNANMEGNLVKGPTGSPTTGWAGWTSSRMTEVINRAHANGAQGRADRQHDGLGQRLGQPPGAAARELHRAQPAREPDRVGGRNRGPTA